MDKFKGFIFAGLAAISYGLNPLFGIPLYQEGMHPYSVLFYRFFLAAIFMGIMMMIQKKSFILHRRYMVITAFAGILMALTCLFWFLTFRIMDSGIAATMLFIYPVMVTAIMCIFFNEKLTFNVAFGIILSLTGVILLCRSGTSANINTAGIIFIMLSALTYAIYIVLVKTSRAKEMQAETLTFYAMLTAVAVFLIPLRMGFDLQMLPSVKALGNAAGLALFPSLCAFLFTAIAVKYIGATRTAILGALEPLTAVTVGITVFGENLSLQLLCGMILIIAAVITVIHGNHSNQEKSITSTSDHEN